MTEINLNKVKLPARVRLRDGREGIVHFKAKAEISYPFMGEDERGTRSWTYEGRNQSNGATPADITAILEEGVTFPPADAPVKAAPAVIDLTKERLPVEARQRNGEQVTVTKALDDGWFEVIAEKGRRTVRRDGRWWISDTWHRPLDIVEIIRQEAPADHIADAGKMIEPTYLERLRDEFAMAAISGSWNLDTSHAKMAAWAYQYADALLAARTASKAGGEA